VGAGLLCLWGLSTGDAVVSRGPTDGAQSERVHLKVLCKSLLCMYSLILKPCIVSAKWTLLPGVEDIGS
jgi:hypothetical protein